MTYDLGYEGTILEIYRHKFKSCSRFNAKQNASCLGALGLKVVVPGLLPKLQKYVLRLTSKRWDFKQASIVDVNWLAPPISSRLGESDPPTK